MMQIDTPKTDREALLIRERDDARESVRIRGLFLKLGFVVIGLGAVMMLGLLMLFGDIRNDVDSNEQERRRQTAERQVLQCFLAEDDLRLATVDDDGRRVDIEKICENYTTLEEGIKSENARGDDGSLPER